MSESQDVSLQPQENNTFYTTLFDQGAAEAVERLRDKRYVNLGEMLKNLDNQKFSDLLVEFLEISNPRLPTICLKKEGDEEQVYMLTAPHAMRNEHLSLWSILEAEGKTEGCEVLFAGSLEGVTPSRDENWDLYLELGKVDFLGVGEKVEMYVPMGRVSDRVKGFPFVNKRFDSQRDLPIYEEMFKPIGVNVVATY